MFSDNTTRPRGRPPGETPQGAATRQAIYETAIELIERDGYENTTLRGIAREAEVSPGLLYRYFPSKRAVVLQLYEDLSLAFEQRAQQMPEGKWRARFGATLRTSLEVLRPYRKALVALVPVLVGGPDEGLFAPATASSRERVLAAFTRAVTEARDAPRAPLSISLGRVLYLAHLGVLLWWLLDRSKQQRATHALVGLIERVITPLSLALRLRSVRGFVRNFDRLIGQGLIGESS